MASEVAYLLPFLFSGSLAVGVETGVIIVVSVTLTVANETVIIVMPLATTAWSCSLRFLGLHRSRADWHGGPATRR